MMKLACVFAVIACVFGAPSDVERSPLRGNGRIVGGETVEISQYPYQVSFLYEDSPKCGGVIYNSTVVLTAAHCTSDRSAEDMTVRAGATLRYEGGEVIQVEDVLTHPNYDGWYDYDLSVLILESPITLNENASAIALAAAGVGPVEGDNVTVTGWGDTVEYWGSPSNTLQAVEVPIVDVATCRYAYRKQVSTPVTDQMFCAGLYGVGGKDACSYDSGGPAVLNNELVGLVSWGKGCARRLFPGVYTNIPAVRDWLTEVLES